MDEEPLSEQVNIRVTPSLRRRIEAEAEAAKRRPSDWLRVRLEEMLEAPMAD